MNPSDITPPRVPFLDPRGLIDRRWYLWLLSVFKATRALEGSDAGPVPADFQQELATLANAALGAPYFRIDSELEKLVEAFEVSPRAEQMPCPADPAPAYPLAQPSADPAPVPQAHPIGELVGILLNAQNSSGYFGIGVNGVEFFRGYTTGVSQVFAPLQLYTDTTANIIALGGVAGWTAFATDCCMFDGTGTQEATGMGTGGLVTHNGTAWKIAGTNVTASA